MKAVILAAGEGTRLKPLTNARPKPMIPIANRPLLEYVIEAVVDAGIREIVLVVGYKRERIQSYFGDGDDWGVDIEYAIQKKQLGTGHAVLQAEPYVGEEFLALNGDRIIESSVVQRVAQERKDGDQLIMSVTRSNHPSDFGVVELDGDRIANITEKPPIHAVSSDIINAGIYGLDIRVFDVIQELNPGKHGELGITSALERFISNHTVRSVSYSGLWLDVSYLWDVLTMNAGVLDRLHDGLAKTARVHEMAFVADASVIGEDTRLRPNATVFRGTALGDNVSIGANVVIANAVVLSDTDIEDGAVIRDCIIGQNVHVGSNTTIEGGRTDVLFDEHLHEYVKLGGVIGDNTSLGGGVTVEPGTIVGNRVTVESGSILTDRVPTDAEVRRG